MPPLFALLHVEVDVPILLLLAPLLALLILVLILPLFILELDVDDKTTDNDDKDEWDMLLDYGLQKNKCESVKRRMVNCEEGGRKGEVLTTLLLLRLFHFERFRFFKFGEIRTAEKWIMQTDNNSNWNYANTNGSVPGKS